MDSLETKVCHRMNFVIKSLYQASARGPYWEALWPYDGKDPSLAVGTQAKTGQPISFDGLPKDWPVLSGDLGWCWAGKVTFSCIWKINQRSPGRPGDKEQDSWGEGTVYSGTKTTKVYCI